MLLNSQANVPAHDVLFLIQNKQTRNLKRWKCHAEKLHAWYDEKNVCILAFFLNFILKKTICHHCWFDKKKIRYGATNILSLHDVSFSCAGEHRRNNFYILATVWGEIMICKSFNSRLNKSVA
jgi:hypothetical protein